MQKRFWGLRAKIVILYILLGIIPITLTGVLSYFTYSNDILRNANQTLDYIQVRGAQDIQGRMKTYKDMIARIVTDWDIIKATKRMNTVSLAADKRILNEKLMTYASLTNGVIGVTCVANSLRYVTCEGSLSADSSLSKWLDATFREDFLIGEMSGVSIQNYEINIYSGLVGAMYRTEDTIFLSFPIFDLVSKEIYGTAVVEVQLSAFLDGMHAEMWDGVSSCLTDLDGTVLAAVDSSLLGDSIESYFEQHRGQLITREMSIENGRLKFYSFTDKYRMTSQVREFRVWVMAIVVLISVLFFTIMFLITRRYTHAITKLARGIEAYGAGVHQIDLNIRKNDEIYIIVDRFKNMMKENDALLSRLREQTENIARMTDARRLSEIKALQAQINPHFLYNTLDTINWIAIDNNQREISSMLKTLGSMLRYSVSNIDQLTLLEAELKWCERYVYLQQKRFYTTFAFEVTAGEEERSFPIHKMLLQPLLENCILHGFEETEDGRQKRIALNCSLQPDGRLSLVLRDNGAGIDEGLLRQIQLRIQSWDAGQSGGIGITNVISRMYLYYGDRCSIQVDSRPGQGTTFRLLIPPAAEHTIYNEELA